MTDASRTLIAVRQYHSSSMEATKTDTELAAAIAYVSLCRDR